MISVKGLVKISLFSLSTLGGILLDIDAFLMSSALISFSTSATLTVQNENLPFLILSLISLMLGWFENLGIILSMGSSETAVFSALLILRDVPTLLKKSFNTSATSKSSYKMSFPSINAISLLPTPLSEKTGFVVFQNILLSVTFLRSKLI